MFHHSRLEVKRKKKKGIICSQNSLSPTYCLTLSGFVLVVLWQHHLQQCCMAHPVQHCFMAYPVQHCFMAHPVQHQHQFLQTGSVLGIKTKPTQLFLVAVTQFFKIISEGTSIYFGHASHVCVWACFSPA